MTKSLTVAQQRALATLVAAEKTTTGRAYTSNRTCLYDHEARIESRTAYGLFEIGFVNINNELIGNRSYERVEITEAGRAAVFVGSIKIREDGAPVSGK